MSNPYNASVMVVDDDLSVLQTCSALLKNLGYSVIACENARDAIAKLKDNRIDVVLTDIRMPVMSGLELLGEIRGLNMDVPVILITAYAELNTAIDAVKNGAFDFIIKPYKIDLLVRSIERAIKHKRLIQ